MKHYTNNWLSEWADFGLDMANQRKKKEEEPSDDPIHLLDVEQVMDTLKERTFGVKRSSYKFFSQMEWGQNDGALQLKFSSFGGLRAVVRKRVTDLEGTPTWICKRVVEVGNRFDKYPDSLSFLLTDILKETDSRLTEAPIADYKGFQRLIIELANTLRRKTTQVIFMYEGIRVVEENKKYIIHFGVTGMGVQRRGQKRLDQFAIHAEYNDKTGLIKITGTPLGDKINKHRWIYDPSNFIEHFSPAQPEEEIVNAILAHFNSY